MLTLAITNQTGSGNAMLDSGRLLRGPLSVHRVVAKAKAAQARASGGRARSIDIDLHCTESDRSGTPQGKAGGSVAQAAATTHSSARF